MNRVFFTTLVVEQQRRNKRNTFTPSLGKHETRIMYLKSKRHSNHFGGQALALVILFAIISPLNLIAQAWQETSKIVPISRDSSDWMGSDIDIDGNFMIVGSPGDQSGFPIIAMNDTKGAAYIYERDVFGNWILVQTIEPTIPDFPNLYGQSVAITQNYAIVGAPSDYQDEFGGNNIPGAGSAFIYKRDGLGNWNLEKKIDASDRNYPAEQFGYDVDIDSNIAVVGSSYGKAYMFERDTLSGIWADQQILTASTGSSTFGLSVNLSGDYLTISAPGDFFDSTGVDSLWGAGAVYTFECNGVGVWIETDKLTAFDREADDQFGIDVSIDGDYIVIGAAYEDDAVYGSGSSSNSGSAYVFKRNGGGTWDQTQKIKANVYQWESRFGESVDIDSNRIVIGSPWDEVDVNDNYILPVNYGSGYVFDRDTSGIWFQVHKIKSYTFRSQSFGSSVAISGDYICAGDRLNELDISGLNSLPAAGAAFIFEPCYSVSNGSATATICSNDSIFLQGQYQNLTGTYYDTLISIITGCDSSLATTLTILPSYLTFDTISIVLGDSVYVGGSYQTTAGTYVDSLQTNVLCDSIVNMTVVVITGIAVQTFNNTTVDIFPNPATDRFTIYLKPASANDYSVDIYSVLGQRIRTMKATTNRITIDLNELNRGIYFIVITDNGSNKRLTKKLIKE